MALKAGSYTGQHKDRQEETHWTMEHSFGGIQWCVCPGVLEMNWFILNVVQQPYTKANVLIVEDLAVIERSETRRTVLMWITHFVHMKSE